ncbi:hypothetical protein [Mycoplasma hafezii]|uniref:hypothetical protein n=1 Tax=Mycoplasma hafezii TaxID=525886 RepID=UPI003CED09A3
MLKRIIFSCGIINLPCLMVSCVTQKNEVQVKSNQEFAKFLNYYQTEFIPIFNLPKNAQLNDYTIEEIWKNNWIDWNEFQQVIPYDNGVITIYGKLISISFNNIGNNVNFKYLWKTKNKKISLVRTYHLSSFKKIELRNEPFCHFGHCHPPSDEPYVITIDKPYKK